jgi:hypothetical protein
MIELDVRTVMFVTTQVITVAVVVVTNKVHIQALRDSNAELKMWVQEVQAQLTDLRIKVGA